MGDNPNALPRFIRAADRLATATGKTRSEVLADWETATRSASRCPNVISPDEVGALLHAHGRSTIWIESQLMHLKECYDCRLLVLVAETSATSFDDLTRIIRLRARI